MSIEKGSLPEDTELTLRMEASTIGGEVSPTALSDQPQAKPRADVYPVLESIAKALLTALSGQQVLVYLATPSEEFFLPLLYTGKLSAADQRLFFADTLHHSTDLLVHMLLQRKQAVVSNLAVSDKRLTPSVATRLNLKKILALPVTAAGDLLGLVIVGRSTHAPAFGGEQIELATAIVSTMALALDNMRLYEETQNRLLESQSLHQITLALLQKLQLDEVLEIVCTEARRLTGAAGSSVSLLEDQKWLTIAYCSGEKIHASGHFSVNDSLLGLAVRRGGPVYINNRVDDNERSDLPVPVTLLALPLRVKNEIISVLDVINKQHGFSSEDVRLIQIYADQAAIAIEHARLSRQVEAMAVVEERQRLARDLHDSVNQSLYGIALYARAAQRQLDLGNLGAVNQHLENLNTTAQDALAEMRRLIFDLRPSILEQEGLASAIEARLRFVEERLGVESGLKVRLDGRLPEHIEDELYRIVQEALNNVIKHAHASQVTVYLIQSGRVLLLKIQDNGVGFDVEAKTNGLGLKTIQERAVRLNAHLSIESHIGQGTMILVEVML